MNRFSPKQECALHFMSRLDVPRHVAAPNKSAVNAQEMFLKIEKNSL